MTDSSKGGAHMASDDDFLRLTGASQNQATGTPGIGLGVGGGSFRDNSKIYLPGFKPIEPFTGIRPRDWDVKGTARQQGIEKPERNTMSAGEARGLPLQWLQNDPETLKKFVNTGVLNKIPGFDVGMGMPEVMQAWNRLLEDSWMMNNYMPGGEDKKFTPWDVMNSYSNADNKFGTVKRGDWLYDIATGEKVKYVGPKSKTSTQKKIDLSNAEDVRAIATNALAELLGRAPNAEELAQFRTSINAFEEKNPLMATTTETLDDRGEVIATETKQTGGVSAEARGLLVSDVAKKGPEYAKFQSGTTYWNSLMQMLGGG